MSIMDKQTQEKMSPNQALTRLQEGHQRFLTKRLHQRDTLRAIEKTSTGQYPFASVLGCIDSRVPAELIFDQGIGDIFNVRIAGNVVNEDILGSLEFACEVAGSKLILVLGHTSCGAIKGACDGVRLGHLSGLLSKITPIIKKDTSFADKSSTNEAFVNHIAFENIKAVTSHLTELSPILSKRVKDKQLLIIGAIYDVQNGQIEFING